MASENTHCWNYLTVINMECKGTVKLPIHTMFLCGRKVSIEGTTFNKRVSAFMTFSTLLYIISSLQHSVILL